MDPPANSISQQRARLPGHGGIRTLKESVSPRGCAGLISDPHCYHGMGLWEVS